ncbi:ATP-binding protein [Paraburkholderia flava]|uniref:ATP-binding protein n=1 Tax=Paraburkholderia flava TaxID=2547393 RepID=UPI001060C9D0|nr:ATP-binding protein [Paraburkholderia flava]
MIDSLKRYLPKSIAAQLTTVVLVSVLLGVLLTTATLSIVVTRSGMRMDPEAKAASEAARIATIVKEAANARSPEQLANVIAGAQSSTGSVRLVSKRELPDASGEASSYVKRVSAGLRQSWHIDPIAMATHSIAVDIGDGRALLFQESERQLLQTFITVQAIVGIGLIVVVVLALSIYAIGWVTRPLSTIARATRAFGQSPHNDDPLDTSGPAEIAQVAEALNDMRRRIRKLVDDRTGMLAAISHDLRTPLTRLKLRSERVTDAGTRAAMLSDISAIDGMVRGALTYLRDGGTSEALQLVDLPSLLQTICDAYSDIGSDVVYSGPARLNFVCRPEGLTRAVMNIIDNGVKHGTQVGVSLEQRGPGAVGIEVWDNGPGIPADLREKVFEPFFKVDSARSVAKSGFGLGLSIAKDIVDRQGGTITLSDRSPCGLCVRLSLRADFHQSGSDDLPASRLKMPPSTTHVSA